MKKDFNKYFNNIIGDLETFIKIYNYPEFELELGEVTASLIKHELGYEITTNDMFGRLCSSKLNQMTFDNYKSIINYLIINISIRII